MAEEKKIEEEIKIEEDVKKEEKKPEKKVEKKAPIKKVLPAKQITNLIREEGFIEAVIKANINQIKEHVEKHMKKLGMDVKKFSDVHQKTCSNVVVRVADGLRGMQDRPFSKLQDK